MPCQRKKVKFGWPHSKRTLLHGDILTFPHKNSLLSTHRNYYYFLYEKKYLHAINVETGQLLL